MQSAKLSSKYMTKLSKVSSMAALSHHFMKVDLHFVGIPGLFSHSIMVLCPISCRTRRMNGLQLFQLNKKNFSHDTLSGDIGYSVIF